MNRGAIHEIEQLDPDLVLVKGDLTADGTDEQYRDFLEFYGEAFGDRLVQTRGNHDVHGDADFAVRADPAGRPAGCDARRPRHVGRPRGRRPRLAASSSSGSTTWPPTRDRPVYVFGHHHVWSPDSARHGDTYFGIDPDSSVRLVELVAARPAIRGYFAGHTHRNRVRHISISRDVPWVEVACVKDFPGGWAEYRVYEGGLLQVFHRISTADAWCGPRRPGGCSAACTSGTPSATWATAASPCRPSVRREPARLRRPGPAARATSGSSTSRPSWPVPAAPGTSPTSAPT